MKELLIIVVLLLAISLSAIEQDKAAHTMVAFMFNVITTQTCYFYTEMSLEECDATGFYSTFFLCLGKETYDKYFGTGWSDKDLLYGFAGLAGGMLTNHPLLHNVWWNMDFGKNEVGINICMEF